MSGRRISRRPRRNWGVGNESSSDPTLDPISPEPVNVTPSTGIAPLLARLIDQQASTGLPPPYLPKNEEGDDT